MTGATHGAAPAAAREAVGMLVERLRSLVERALAGATVQERAYCLCLWSGDDPEDLVPANLSLGLEPDIARTQVPEDLWNPGTHRVEGLQVTDPSDPAFTAAAERFLQHAREVGEIDPAHWLLQEVALAMTESPPPIPVTEDFVVYAFATDYDAVDEAALGAGPARAARLRAKGMLPDA